VHPHLENPATTVVVLESAQRSRADLPSIFYAFFTVGDFARNDTGRDFLDRPCACLFDGRGNPLPKDGVQYLTVN
jgi:hypothetical protein